MKRALAAWGIAAAAAVGATVLWTHREPLIESRHRHGQPPGSEQLAMMFDDGRG